jgi:hypothetical protein
MQDLIDLYEDMKSRSGKLDFVDLLTRTRDLIKENAAVRELLQTRFTHIFVDEFQDTDPVQAEILILLSSGDPAQADWYQVRPAPGKLFVVGDPKQSIYRFRRADIILYQALCERLSAQGIAILQLSRSFRAVRPIQDVVNAAFAPEMLANKDTGQPGYVPLEEFSPAGEQPGLVVLPVPSPYGMREVTKGAILASLPDAVAGKLGLVLGFDYGRVLVKMLSDGPGFISPAELRGIVGFPSYHTLQALVLAWYARSLKVWRWPAIVLNLGVLAAIPIQGGHHLVDAFGGATVTIISISLAGWIVSSAMAMAAPIEAITANSGAAAAANERELSLPSRARA